MTKSTSSISRAVLVTVVLWVLALSLMLLLRLPLWVDATVLSLASVFSVGIWKWRRVRLLLDEDHLSDRLRLLSDAELQDALESVAEFKATLGQPDETTVKPIRHLLQQLNENQLILMKERLQRAGFYDDAPPAIAGITPLVNNYSPEKNG